MQNIDHPAVTEFAKLLFDYSRNKHEPFSEIAAMYEAVEDSVVLEAQRILGFEERNTFDVLPQMIVAVTLKHSKSSKDVANAAMFLADAMTNLFDFELSETGELHED